MVQDSNEGQLRLSPDMLINEVAKGDAGMLVDEQEIAGEHPSGARITNWSVAVPEGETAWYLPANSVIDLGREHMITRIYLYDGEDTLGNVQLNYGIPFRWTHLLTDPLSGNNEWNQHQAGSIRTRYLKISKETDADLREIVLYGYPTGPAQEPEKAATTVNRRPVTDQKIGINSYVDDPMDKAKVAGIVREYHHWHYNQGGFMRAIRAIPIIRSSGTLPVREERILTALAATPMICGNGTALYRGA